MSTTYKLSATLEQHGADVRCVSASSPEVSKDCRGDIVLTGSRDRRAIIWHRSAGNQFTSALEIGNHEGFVNACTLLRSDAAYAITAGQDKIIYAYQLLASQGQISVQLDAKTSEPQPTRTLIGHTENVCALDVGPHGQYLVSGSWDKTAKIWRNWECVATLKGHEQSVWAVLAVDHDRVLTASADKTIRLWSISSPAKPIAVFGGHTDAVRGLTLLEGGESFASCGNDGNIHLYSLHEASSSGSKPIQPVQVLSGHTSFVYSLDTIPGGKGELVSSGEDRSVRVWRDGALVQTITLPAISVWSVSVLPNGDIVAGSSDAAARVFTRDTSLVADDATLKAYDHAISTQTLNQTQVGDIKKDELPGVEALSQPGSKEGQTKMVKNGDVVEAHQWSAASQQWVKIGEVVGGVGSGSKKLYEGKEYDYVFDVDIADGVPPLKLPFNLSENPYAAAQRFLEKNDLPQQYIDQVVQFIDKNTTGVNLGAPQYADPYTGASRYQPAGSSSSAASAAASASAPQSNIPSGDSSIYTGARNVDPYTSSAAPSSSAASAARAAASSSILPQRTFLAFRTANFSAIKNKLTQVNQQESVQLSAAEMGQIDQLIGQLEAGSSGGLNVDALRKAVTSWSAGSRLPALDLIRCAAAVGTTTAPLDIAKEVFEASSWAEDWPTAGSPEAKVRDVNSMLALRTIANLWNDSRAVGELEVNGVSLLGSLGDTHYAKLSKNGRIAFATVVYNATAQMVGGMGKNPAAGITLGLINEVLSQEEEDSEAVYRILVALGNLLCSSSGNSLNRNALDTSRQSIQRLTASSLGKEQRIAQIGSEVSSLF
ncbi:related to DOA1 - involved in ubiquitin-dependent proteolysis [Ustilago trichophora]|uniref:Related to DOA1 - involved in ubiquitin-dependent proteolysis n=1 Tax=Ustilago trichophora TaxID=86804 RepID=A0A5C3EAX0_9BASI|nr:related to DOA1 - involved in ubiquitin-dependent proteolysis [Ustilago trichophora]